MALPLINSNLSFGRGIQQTRQQIFDLQRQLSTGKTSTTYGELGSERNQVLSLRGELSQVQGYQKSIEQVQIRLKVAQTSLGRLRDLASNVRTDTIGGGFELLRDGQTRVQTISRGRLDEVVSLLNTDVAGRHIFAGRQTDQRPVVPANELIEGAGGRAGFRQIAAERRLADIGDGKGRLEIPAVSGTTVNLTEDATGSPFGFKLGAVNSSLDGLTVTGPSGSPADLALDFAAQPSSGQSISITLALPDGSSTDLILTAKTGDNENPGDFQIGATSAQTAANFQAALATQVERQAQTTLSAASLFAATNDFFDFDADNPPQRIDGPPFETATAQKDATADDTVFWYRGDPSTSSARESSVTRADDAILVAYGARANEDAFKTTIKQLAALSVETFDGADPTAQNRFEQITGRVNQSLGFPQGKQSINDVVAELTVSQVSLGAAQERHTATSNYLQNSVANIEEADLFEVTSQLLQLQTRLQASYQTTSILAKISLVNFI